MRRRSLLCCGVILMSLEAAVQAGEYIHLRWKDGRLQLKTLYLLPAGVEMRQVGVRGVESLGKEAEEVMSGFAKSVAAGLARDGFTVTAPFTEDALKDKTDLKYAVADVQRKFDQITPQLLNRKNDVSKGLFTVGDIVANLNADGKAGALVIIRAVGTRLTKGRALLELGLGAARSVSYSSHITVLDARTGDVIFFSDRKSREIPQDDHYARLFRKLIPRK